MAGIRRASDLGTQGIKTILDGSVQTADIANNAITQAKLNTDIPLSGFRNAIINGDFSVNQRAFTSTTTSGQYGFDRWVIGTSGGTTTYSTQSFALGNTISGQEPANYARCVVSGQSSAGHLSYIAQRIESVRTFAGQAVTISFWAKAESNGKKVFIELNQDFGSGGSPSAQNSVSFGQVTLTTSWVRYQVTGTVTSISGKTIGTGGNDQLVLGFWLSAGSDFNTRTGSLGTQAITFDLWGVQVEAGSVATPFERRPQQVELALCQRYYFRMATTSASDYAAYGAGTVVASGYATMFFKMPTTMRAVPTSLGSSAVGTFYVETATGAGNPTAITIYRASQDNFTVNLTKASTVAGYGCALLQNGTNASYLEASAEL